MIRLVTLPIRIAVRLLVVSLVCVGLITAGGVAGVGPMADELAGDDAPLAGTTVDGIADRLVGSAGGLDDRPLGADSTTEDEREVERLITEEVNEERDAEDLDRLERDGDLRRIARNHSTDMDEDGYVGHESPDGVTPGDRLASAGCAAGGENVAQSWIDEPVNVDGETITADTNEELAAHLVAQWMDSPGHRENILRESYATSGVGVVITEDNRVYATQNFCADRGSDLF
ncbi:MAG: CAP domain-containing protein [Halohasta sp.]